MISRSSLSVIIPVLRNNSVIEQNAFESNDELTLVKHIFMKKILLATMLFTTASFYANAQSVLDKAKSATGTTMPSFDVKSIASQVMGSLGPSLALSAIQNRR